LLLKANVLLAKGDRPGGIKHLEKTLVSDPYNHANRLRLTELLLEEGELLEAKKHLEQLLNSDSKSSTYNNLMKKVDELIEQERARSESGPSS
jgi:predicted Zn-dependent protease